MKMPDLIVNNVEIELPDDLRAKYNRMEKEFFLTLDSGKEVEAFNAAALTNKLLQFSNGAMYPVAGMPLWEPIHDLKLDALEEIIDEANGQPVFCSYAYRSDAERIMERFKDIDPINLTECKSEQSLATAMHRWKTGDCRLMIAHPASAGHGIDGLQKTGHTLVWYGLNWSLELYDQFNARLRRQGQGVPVICHRIMCKDTLDQAQALALDEKATTQAGLRSAVKQYRQMKGD
jgi:SNF2 family DNA or RNA helicase